MIALIHSNRNNIVCVQMLFREACMSNGEYLLLNTQLAYAEFGTQEQIAAILDQCKGFKGDQCENVAKCAELLDNL